MQKLDEEVEELCGKFMLGYMGLAIDELDEKWLLSSFGTPIYYVHMVFLGKYSNSHEMGRANFNPL